MKATVKAVIFDFGNVLTLSPRPEEVLRLRELCRLPPELFTRLYGSLRLEFDRGTMAAGEYWSQMLQAGGLPPTPERIRSLLETDIRSWTRINRPMLRWSERLRRQGFSTAILSNMPREILVHLRRSFPWIQDFAAQVFSCDVGLIKPEPGIFAHCLSLLNLEPAETLFLDDNPENAAAATRLGMHALVYRSLQECARQIDEGFDLPGPEGQALPVEVAEE